MSKVIGPAFTKYLIEEGLVPDDCRIIDVKFTASAIPTVIYEVFLTDDRLDRFQRAFLKYLKEHGEKAK